MILSVVVALAATVIAAPIKERAAANGNVVGAYLLIDPKEGPAKLAQVVAQASTIPVNRVTLSFVRPDMYYEPGSNTLVGSGFNYADGGDYGFADVKAAVSKIQAAGVDVYLSMGGWDYNCWPYTYLRYSVAPYGGANADIIKQYGNGNIDNCVEANQWCYACEPPSNGNSGADSFAIFPEPAWSANWVQATKDIEAAIATNGGAVSAPAVTWHPQIYGGQNWTDPVTKTVQKVVGRFDFATKKRDPYTDLVYLAKDLGLAGIDLDYEEFWHADTFKTGDAKCTNPCQLWQTVYKYSAIVRDFQLSIAAIYPTLKLSTAAAAVGAWNGDWWGGNMKGLWYGSYQIMPSLTQFMTQGINAGGLNVMAYDISTTADECPQPGVCSLSQQVDFYLGTYKTMLSSTAGVYVGYEVGTPAYPADYTYMANLTQSEFSTLQSNTQSQYPGGFYWEMYKGADSAANVDVNTLSQKLCTQLLPGQTRCQGNLPTAPVPAATTTTAAVPATTTTTAAVPKTTTTAAAVQTTTAAVQTTTAAVVQTTTAAVIQTTTAVVVKTTTTAASGQTPCAAPYDSTKTYLKGDQASEGGFNYVANWYALNNDPAANSAPYSQWTNLGACGGTGPVVTTTAAVVKTTTAAATTTVVVVKTTTTAAVVKTTTTAAPVKTTTAAAGGNTIVVGQPCTTNGQWACNNTVICAYGSSSTLVWTSQGLDEVYGNILRSFFLHQRPTNHLPESSSSMGAATDPATATDPFTHLLFAPKPRLAQLYAEVHTPSTLFVQIRGRWFDVAAFAKTHPGGETALRLAAGRDATAMFESAHVFADKKKLDALLRKFVLSDEEAQQRGLRTLESALSESDRTDEKNEFGENIDWTFGGPFQTEVNRRVVAYFDSEAKRKGITRIQATKATPEKWALILVTGFLFIVSMCYLVRGNRWMVLMAPTMGWFCGVNCFHDGLHFALSTSPFVNEFVGGLFPFFSSPLGWFHQHIIGHHVHTNMKYHDPDLVHGIEARREHKDHPFLPIYKHQSTFLSIGFHFVVGTWLGLGLLNDFKLILSPTLSYNGFVPRIPMTTTALITHGVTRAIYYIGLFGWPYWTFTAAEKGFLEKFMFSMGPAIVFPSCLWSTRKSTI
ncbi:hypothetical protein BCR33DRAFT_732568 [Rhizoclosmatium globosum]|uniref:Cytochrome b5 heme-binding domain-containing protein n=1 Tax=Rhizoclosmatium globosum TaxID=329046 RepID=A0A1Y2D3U2_9FUNG|nr:hypothetical protein BCR33DRAFT_732568 [Rhizoclosmatium globosum]|eukprot:ORY53776.1 hypothetical protein BCR33DRAFT_732568 [Rhizoclosmatium globosum]